MGVEDESDANRRSKRRRPRRRRPRSHSEEAKAGASPEAEHPEQDAFDLDDDIDLDDLHDSGAGVSRSGRAGHRNVPTWQDAVGVMVEKNLASRSKNPGGGQAQKRGGRRSGRRGGGQGRS